MTLNKIAVIIAGLFVVACIALALVIRAVAAPGGFNIQGPNGGNAVVGVVTAVGASAGASCTATATAKAPSFIYPYSYWVDCDPATGSTSNASITITGLGTIANASVTITRALDENQTNQFTLQDYLPPAHSVDAATNVVLTVPAVSNGGKCWCGFSFSRQ